MSLLGIAFGKQGEDESGPAAASRSRQSGSQSSGFTSTRVQAAAAHRIRLGLTGLGAIFLLVMVATAGLRPGVRAAAIEPTESLAMLGVAPGAGPSGAGEVAQAAARAGAATAAPVPYVDVSVAAPQPVVLPAKAPPQQP